MIRLIINPQQKALLPTTKFRLVITDERAESMETPLTESGTTHDNNTERIAKSLNTARNLYKSKAS